MAHNLATIGNKVAMAYRGEDPWHRLGERIPASVQTVAAVAAFAHLDYTVTEAPMFLGDGRPVEIRKALLRDGREVLSTVGADYQIVQNVEAFGIADDLVSAGSMKIETAGALGAGEVAWMQLRNGQPFEVGAGDVVKPLLLVVTSHDGSRAVQAIPTFQRVVCRNTLQAVKDRTKTTVRHTKAALARLDEARRILNAFYRTTEATAKAYRQMARTPLSLAQLVDYWEAVFPTRKSAEDEGREVVAELIGAAAEKSPDKARERQEICAWLLENGKGTEMAGRTAWGAYNAVTEFVDHVYVARQNGTPTKNGARSALFGTGARLKDTAFQAAAKLAGVR